jgi:hypothetical protein
MVFDKNLQDSRAHGGPRSAVFSDRHQFHQLSKGLPNEDSCQKPRSFREDLSSQTTTEVYLVMTITRATNWVRCAKRVHKRWGNVYQFENHDFIYMFFFL